VAAGGGSAGNACFASGMGDDGLSNESIIDNCTAGGSHKGIRTIQLGIVVHDRTNTNQNAVMHRPHPVLRNISIAYRGFESKHQR
jgi:hypothetical protein